jgi:hypothetical protein
MKHPVLALLGLLAVAAAPVAQAVEILRWERMPLAVPLKVGQERIVFIDRNVRVGVPAGVGERLRVQSAGGAVYLRASEPIEPTRLQLQDADTGALILLDIAAEPPKDGEAELEPVRIVEGDSSTQRAMAISRQCRGPGARPGPGRCADRAARNPGPGRADALRRAEPLRAAAHRGAAAGRHAGQPAPRPRPRHADADAARARGRARVVAPGRPVGHCRAPDQHQRGWVTLDPRVLQGDFLTATFQHEALGPRGTPEDTTVLYLVTRGRGLAQSLLPAIHRFDPAVHLPQPEDRPTRRQGGPPCAVTDS